MHGQKSPTIDDIPENIVKGAEVHTSVKRDLIHTQKSPAINDIPENNSVEI
jgi:hypothetical protein